MFSNPEETAEADYTLARLYEEGTDALTVDVGLVREGEDVDIQPVPKATYEIAEGVVGTMPFPTLGIQEAITEINAEHVAPLFKEDAKADDVRNLVSKDPEKVQEGAENSVKEGVTTNEFSTSIDRANCLEAIEILDFEGDEPSPEDVNQQMASVVVNHFTALRPGTSNGRQKS